jgi:hypothetical protein
MITNVKPFCLTRQVALGLVVLSLILVPYASQNSLAAESDKGHEKAKAGMGVGAAIAAAAVTAGLSPAVIVGLALGAAAAVVGIATASSGEEKGKGANNDANHASLNPDSD